jgi:hypothetical protein
MGLILAAKAFFRALGNRDAAKEFLEAKSQEAAQIEQKPRDASHLRLLRLLQKGGRLIDFLKEDISGYTDAQVGAAARRMHQECATLLEDLVTVRRVSEETEGSQVTVPSGSDAHSFKLLGNVLGEPPYTGRLVHAGWRAHKRSLPKAQEANPDVLHPAEIELR